VRNLIKKHISRNELQQLVVGSVWKVDVEEEITLDIRYEGMSDTKLNFVSIDDNYPYVFQLTRKETLSRIWNISKGKRY